MLLSDSFYFRGKNFVYFEELLQYKLVFLFEDTANKLYVTSKFTDTDSESEILEMRNPE